MQSKIFFRSWTERDYELTVEHGPDQYVPTSLVEDLTDVIDAKSGKKWPSLIHMTQDLKVEIVDWGSDVGD